MTRFSVVIPTHNRADFLQHSLASACGQTFDDYEVIVSNNASSDHTEEVAAGFASPRLKRYRTKTLLSMVDHWEFALGKATGEWVLLVCDDDALLPCGLARLDGIIRDAKTPDVIQYDRLRYVYDDGARPEGNYVELGSRVARGVRTLKSSRRLHTVFWRMSIDMPKLLNSAVSRALIERIRRRYGRVFGLWAPDLYVGAKLLAQTESYLKTGPLMLWGENMRSYGSGARRDPGRLVEFFAQFPEFDGTLSNSPYPHLITVTNGIYDTLCRIRADLGPDHGPLRINPLRFRSKLLGDIEQYVERGHDGMRADRDRIRRDLARLRLERCIHPVEGLRSVAYRASSLPEKLQKLARGRKTAGRKRRHEFPNIHEAARFVDTLPEV